MPSSKRFHGWTKRRFLPFGSDFCGLTPEVALARRRTCDQLFILTVVRGVEVLRAYLTPLSIKKLLYCLSVPLMWLINHSCRKSIAFCIAVS